MPGPMAPVAGLARRCVFTRSTSNVTAAITRGSNGAWSLATNSTLSRCPPGVRPVSSDSAPEVMETSSPSMNTCRCPHLAAGRCWSAARSRAVELHIERGLRAATPLVLLRAHDRELARCSTGGRSREWSSADGAPPGSASPPPQATAARGPPRSASAWPRIRRRTASSTVPTHAAPIVWSNHPCSTDPSSPVATTSTRHSPGSEVGGAVKCPGVSRKLTRPAPGLCAVGRHDHHQIAQRRVPDPAASKAVTWTSLTSGGAGVEVGLELPPAREGERDDVGELVRRLDHADALSAGRVVTSVSGTSAPRAPISHQGRHVPRHRRARAGCPRRSMRRTRSDAGPTELLLDLGPADRFERAR